VDKAGNLYISDTGNSRIRRVAPNGVIATIAGNGQYGYSGDGGPAPQAQLNFPSGLSIDSNGNIYIADTQNNVLRMLTPPANPGVAPAIPQGGVVTASDFGGSSTVAPGGWVEIYGTNLAASTRAWTNADFTYFLGPTSLGGTTVSIGGLPAFIGYISPGQVNVELPSNVAEGPQFLSVATASGTSSAYQVTVSSAAASLWAPPLLKLSARQYVGAALADGNFALPAGAVKGISSRPAKPGETITVWGIGFGPVTPSITAGRIALVDNAVTGLVQASIGGLAASVTSGALAKNSVGLYQFTVTVPNVPANSAAPFTFTLNGAPGPQTLFIAIGN
jgi:uncharacterized protein (TIGR03437 family)